MAMPSTTGTMVALRNGSRVVRRASQPNDKRGLTGVPRSTDKASKYLFDWPVDRSEYSKNGTSASSQPQARAAVNAKAPRPAPESEAEAARPQTVTGRRAS